MEFRTHLSPEAERLKGIVDLLLDEEAVFSALEAIVRSPHREIQTRKVFGDVGEASTISASLLGQSVIETGGVERTHRMRHFMGRGGKWRFLHVYHERVERILDNAANRFVGEFLRRVTRELRLLCFSLRHECMLKEYLVDARLILRRLSAMYSSNEMFQHQGERGEDYSVNQVLRCDAHYRVILNCYLGLY